MRDTGRTATAERRLYVTICIFTKLKWSDDGEILEMSPYFKVETLESFDGESVAVDKM